MTRTGVSTSVLGILEPFIQALYFIAVAGRQLELIRGSKANNPLFLPVPGVPPINIPTAASCGVFE